jgi:hypothetical protein
VELGREGAEDLGHHDTVQFSLIDRRISNIGEDVVVEGVATKCEKHDVTPLLVIGRRGFQNDRDNRSYVLEAGSLHMLVRGERGVGVAVGVDGGIIVVILGDHDPLGSGELLFQVMDDGLLLLQSEGGERACPCVVQGLACSSHDSDESLLLSVCGSGGGLSRRGVVLLTLGGVNGLLPVNGREVGVTVRHGRQDGGG